MSGTPDLTTALVLLALFAALLLGLLSYHHPRGSYVTWGVGLLVLATAVALLLRALSPPSLPAAIVLLLLFLAVMMVLLAYQGLIWVHAAWWTGVLLFVLSLPFLGAGRSDLALLCLIAGPGLLMLVAVTHPEVPARYARLAAPGDPAPLTAADLATERRRYTQLAAGLTLLSLAGVWLLGGVPQGPVSQAAAPLVVDEALAQRGAQLFGEYGCSACHSVTGQAGAGPTLKGVYGHRVRLGDGSEIIADEAYIRESIADPDAKIVAGFGKGVMAGAVSPRLQEVTQPNNANALVEYIKSLAK